MKKKEEEEKRKEQLRPREDEEIMLESADSPRSKSAHNSDDSEPESDRPAENMDQEEPSPEEEKPEQDVPQIIVDEERASSGSEAEGNDVKSARSEEDHTDQNLDTKSADEAKEAPTSEREEEEERLYENESSDEKEMSDLEQEKDEDQESDGEEETEAKKDDPIEEKEKEAISLFWAERTKELQKTLESGNAIYSDDLYLPIVEEEPLEEVLHCPASSSKELLLFALTKAMAYFKLLHSALLDPSNEWEDREEVEDILQLIDETLRRNYAKLSM